MKQKSVKITNEIKDLFVEAFRSLPKAKRFENSNHIKDLCEYLGVDEATIFENRQGKHWSKRSEEEKLEIVKNQMEYQRNYQKNLREKIKDLRKNEPTHLLDCRGEWSEELSLDKIAEYLGKSSHSITLKIAKSQYKKALYNIEDKIYTVSPIKK